MDTQMFDAAGVSAIRARGMQRRLGRAHDREEFAMMEPLESMARASLTPEAVPLSAKGAIYRMAAALGVGTTVVVFTFIGLIAGVWLMGEPEGGANKGGGKQGVSKQGRPQGGKGGGGGR